MHKRFAVVLLALSALPLSAQVPQAVALMGQGRYAEAKKILTPLANDPEALDTLAKIAMIQDDEDEAEKLIQKAIRLRPNSAVYHFRLGEVYGNEAMSASIFGKASLAGKVRDEFLKAVELDPNMVEPRFGLIDFYTLAPSIMGGDTDKALAQAAEIKKRDAFQGHRAYSRIYQRQKKTDLARKEYLDLVREQPQSARAHATLAAFYAGIDKNYKAAFDEADAAVKLDPAYMPAYFRIGAIASASGAQLQRGEEALRKYIAHQPKDNEPSLADGYYVLGLVLEKLGRKPEAKQAFTNALRFAPNSKPVTEALKRVS